MRAIVQDRYGAPSEVLRLAEVDKPTAADNAVLVRVRATSVNAGDWRRVRAQPSFVRLVEGLRRPKSPQLGGDAAGVVEGVGKNVAHLRVGDEAYGIRTGAFAEYVSGRSFVRKPRNLTFEQAAAVPIAGITALQGLRDKGGLKSGQRVLINGAGGGVGTFAVQLAKAFGAHVTAVTHGDNTDLMRSLGADEVIDYTRDDFTRGTPRYDLVLDVGGTPSLGACRRALAPGGTLVCVGASRGPGGPMFGLLAALVRSRLLRQRVVSFIAKVRTEDIETLTDLIEAGKVTPVVERTYELSEIADALGQVESGRARGKVVVTV
jgi:NADPH:quinone reductase-like Zn-dependent oxidoreductase